MIILLNFVIATHNKNKVGEIESILRRTLDASGNDESCFSVITAGQLGIGEIEETGSTFEENARIKACALTGRGYIAIADDSGLEVDALGGAPGVHSARYSGGDSSENNRKLLRELDGVPDKDRTARFVSVICCIFPDGRELICRGECTGTILREATGTGGFGYDPLFYYEPRKKTFAEMSSEEKNRVSHRARALENFSDSFAKMNFIY